MRGVARLAFALLVVAGCGAPHTAPPAGSADHAKADAVMRVVRNGMAHLRAVIAAEGRDRRRRHLRPGGVR